MKPFDGSTLIKISSKEFLLFGGKTSLGVDDKIYYYNFESNIWEVISKMNYK